MTNLFPGASLTNKIVAKCYGFVNTSVAFPRRVKEGRSPSPKYLPFPSSRGRGYRGWGSQIKSYLWIVYEYN